MFLKIIDTFFVSIVFLFKKQDIFALSHCQLSLFLSMFDCGRVIPSSAISRTSFVLVIEPPATLFRITGSLGKNPSRTSSWLDGSMVTFSPSLMQKLCNLTAHMNVAAEFDSFVRNGLLNVVHLEQRIPKAISTLILSCDKWKLKQLLSDSDFSFPEKGVRRVSEQVHALSPIKN